MDLRAACCHHCGEPLPAEPVLAEVKGERHAYCCGGCAGAAGWIDSAGLADYYRLRESLGRRVDPQAQDYRAYDREDVLREHSRAVGSDAAKGEQPRESRPSEAAPKEATFTETTLTESTPREITLIVEGMRCAACAWLIDRAIGQLPGVDEVSVNAISGRLQLRWRPSELRLSAVLERLAALGYSPHLSPGEGLERARRKERRQLLLRLGVAGLGSLQAMMFAEALYLDFANEILALVDNPQAHLDRRPLPVDDPKKRRPDTTLAEELLGWKPKVSRAEGLAKTLPYFREKVG